MGNNKLYLLKNVKLNCSITFLKPNQGDNMNTFEIFNIKKELIDALSIENITQPTSIQLETINHGIQNKDIIAEAITGSGKTLAYIIPAFERIDSNSKELHTIVLAPTHELVVQINNVVKQLAINSKLAIRSTPIIGEVNIKRQIESLKSKPHIIIGTPGRVLELIKLKKIKAHQVKTIVLDEADKLLSDNYSKTIKEIIKTTLKERQILVYSASINQVAIDRARDLMKNPIFVNLPDEKVNKDIEHFCIIVERRDKIDILRKVIHATKPIKTIVFINRNEQIQDVVSKLNYHHISTVGIYGNATKADRKKSLDAFRSGKSTVLVASDLVARGLDLQDITHIINLDIPSPLNEYLHRVGRTGRAGNKGIAISIITEKEIASLIKIEEMTDVVIQPKQLFKGKLVDYK